VVLLIALGVRLYRIHDAFWTDELYHVIGAHSLLETGKPYVPGYKTGQYLRAYPVTWLTATAFDWFGDTEAAARIPFLCFNMVFLAVAFLVVRRWFNVHLAMILVMVLALAPHELILGREVRMYGLFQLLYFSAAAIGFEVVEGAWWPLRRRQALLLVSFLVLLLLSAWVQLLTLNLAIAFGGYFLVMALVSGKRTRAAGLSGWRGALQSVYFRLLALLVVGAFAVWRLAPTFVAMLFRVARERPAWSSTMPAGEFYWWLFFNYYPAFTCCYLLGTVLLIRRYGRRGVFIACAFLPLMFLHVVAFTGRVEERYVSYLLPYFLIGACYLVEVMLRPFARHVAAEWRGGSRVIALSTALALAPVPFVFAHSWLRETKNLLQWGYGPDWKTVVPTLEELTEKSVVMSPWALHVAYYSGDFPDYILRHVQPEDGAGESPYGQLGARKVPVRWLFDAGEFERIVAQEDVSVIATDWAFNNDAYIDADMRAAIERHLVLTKHPGDPKVLIYRKAR